MSFKEVLFVCLSIKLSPTPLRASKRLKGPQRASKDPWRGSKDLRKTAKEPKNTQGRWVYGNPECAIRHGYHWPWRPWIGPPLHSLQSHWQTTLWTYDSSKQKWLPYVNPCWALTLWMHPRITKRSFSLKDVFFLALASWPFKSLINRNRTDRSMSGHFKDASKNIGREWVRLPSSLLAGVAAFAFISMKPFRLNFRAMSLSHYAKSIPDWRRTHLEILRGFLRRNQVLFLFYQIDKSLPSRGN